MQRNTHILIADDDAGALLFTQNQIKNIVPHSRMFTASNAEQAAKILQQMPVDVLILDVRMPDLSGFELLESLPIPSHTKIIFQTEFSEYALKAFDFNPVHFLVKPVSSQKLHEALVRALDVTSTNSQANNFQTLRTATFLRNIICRKAAFRYRVDCESISHITSDVGFCVVHCREGSKHICDASLTWLSNKLNSDTFIRANRSTIVSLNYLVGMIGRNSKHPMKVTLAQNIELEISRKQEVAIREKFMSFKA